MQQLSITRGQPGAGLREPVTPFLFAQVQRQVIAGDSPQPRPQRATGWVKRCGGAGRRHHRLLDHISRIGALGPEQARNATPDPLGIRVVERLPGGGLAFAQSLRDEPLLLLIQHQWLRRKGSLTGAPVRPSIAVPRAAPRLSYRVFARRSSSVSEELNDYCSGPTWTRTRR